VRNTLEIWCLHIIVTTVNVEMSRFGPKRAPRRGVPTCALGAPNAYRATILRAPKGNVGLAVRKTVVALINQNLGQSLALCFVGGDRVAQRQWELHCKGDS